MTIHRWTSRDGDFDKNTSWSTDTPPTVGKSTLELTQIPGDTEDVTIDGKTYTYQDVLTNVNGNVLIGGTIEASRDNLLNAINLGSGSGTAYAAATTLHTTVLAEANSTDKLDAIGKTGGTFDTIDNARAVTEGLANGSWDQNPLLRVARWATTDKALFTKDNIHPATKNLDQSLVDIAVLFIGEGFEPLPEDDEQTSADIGSEGDPLIISADVIVHRGKGTLYFDNSSIGSAPDTTDKIIIAYTGDKSRLAASLKGGKMTTVAVARGLVHFHDGATSLLAVSYEHNAFSDATVIVFNTGTGLAEIRMVGGTVTLQGDSDVDLIHMTDGLLIVESIAYVAKILRILGGIVEWNTTTALQTVELYSGTLDLTRTTHNKTIGVIFQWPDGRFEYSPDLTTFTRRDFDGLTETGG